MAAKKSAPKASKPKKTAAAKSAPTPAKGARKAATPARKPPAKAGRATRAASPPPKAAAAARPATPVQKIQTSVPTKKIPLTPARMPAIEAAEDDAGDNLLAGPRNVQPYVVKRGEQYMSKEQLDHFRRILVSWKRDLMMEVDRTVSHMKDEAANFPDPNDRATQEEEFSLELRTRDRERKLIRKIDEALGRIEDGS
jgi:DnaK suppressor protein